MKLQYELSGTYDIKVLRADGSVKTHLPEVKNMIVNQGLDRFGNTTSLAFMNVAFAGSGGTAPVATNTTMQAYLGETTAFTSDQAESTYSTPRYFVQKRVFSFAVGAVVGNVAEVGVGWKPDASTRLVFSRALVVDSGGTPTTITVLASEQLVLTYRLYIKIPDAPVTFTHTAGGTTYTINAQVMFTSSGNGFSNFPSGFFGAAGAGAYASIKETNVLPAINSSWSSAGAYDSGVYTPPAYVNGSYKQTLPAVFTAAGGVFATGVGSALFYTRNGCGIWAMNFSPKIPKVAGQSLSLTMEISWARGTPP